MSVLTRIFSSVLGVDESAVTPALSPENTPSWDSLNAIILLTEIEKALDTRFEYEEAMAIKSFGDVRALVASKGKNPDA
jgi:acyl carrier protein